MHSCDHVMVKCINDVSIMIAVDSTGTMEFIEKVFNFLQMTQGEPQ